MKISRNQKKFIAKYYRSLSVEEIAQQLHLRERDIQRAIYEMETGHSVADQNERLVDLLDKAIEYGIYLLLLVAPLFFIKYTHQFATLSKVVFVEISVSLLFVLWCVRVGIEKRFVFTKSPLVFPLVLYFLLSLCSTFWATNPFESIHYNVYLFVCMLLYLLVEQTITTHQQARHLIRACIMGGVAVAMIGILQHLTGFEGIPQDARPASTLGNKNFGAQYIIMVLPLVVVAFGLSRHRLGKIFSLCAGGVMFLYLLFTRTRGAWVGLLIAGGFLAVSLLLIRGGGPLTAWFRKRRQAVSIVIPSLLLLVLLLSLVRLPLVGMLQGKINLIYTLKSIVNLHDRSTQARLNMWQNTWRMTTDHLFTGVGVENFKICFPPYSHAAAPTEVTLSSTLEHAHNDYLQIASELGVTGLLFFLWIMASYFFMLERILKSLDDSKVSLLVFGLGAGVLALLIHSCVDFPNRLPVPMLFTFLFLGVGTMLYRMVPGAGRVTIELNRTSGQWAARTLSGFAFIFLVTITILGIRFLCADYHLLMSKAYYANHRNDLAYQEAKKMIDFYPFFYKYWITWGSVNSMTGNYDEAIEINHKALKYDPYRFQLLFNQGNNYLALGKHEEAAGYFKKLLEMSPNLAEAREALALAESAGGGSN